MEISALLAALAGNLSDKAISGAAPGVPVAEVRGALQTLADKFAPAESVRQKKGSPVDRAVLYTDGASRGNPGEAAGGASLVAPDGSELLAGRWYLGRMTNNAAEYLALIHGLEETAALGVKDLEVRMDSELVVRQLTGVYRVKDARLKQYFARVKELFAGFAAVRIKHVPRAENRRADQLANEALDASRRT